MKKSFTFIELLIVIAVMGILTSLVIPNIVKFNNAKKEIKQEENNKQVEEISSTRIRYNGIYYTRDHFQTP